jgi:tetratricopeptide (TPR) repeat protein/TolB-like protein/tRNA A-37 threonylcarbamoyl transferase component Bud32
VNPDRWEHVQKLYFNVVDLAPNDRTVLLERECENDPDMEHEVGSLLKYRERIGNFLEETAIQVLARTYTPREFAAPPLQDFIGSVIADRYIVTKYIGSGGMGGVYRGNHQVLGTPVAIKRIASRFRNRKEYRQNLVKEARKAARLDHENIAKVTDAVEESGEVFVIMEYIDGETIRTRLERELGIDEFLDIAVQCTSGLAAAHRERIVHLDLKPENIMLTRSLKVKICDFGMARQLPENDNDTDPASDWRFGGTPAYMAPEVMESNRFDARADLFSLGLVFYEMLAGKNPFLADDVKTTTNRIRNEIAEPLSNVSKKVPRRLIRLIEKMLAKNPANRPETADEVLLELHTIRSHHRFFKEGWSGAREMATQLVRRPLTASVIALAVLTAGLSLTWMPKQGSLLRFEKTFPQKELAVLPFKNVGDDPSNQAFCDGLVETLTNKLSQLDQFQNVFRVKAASEIRGISTARDAHRIFGVALAITGSVQRLGNSVYLTMNLVDARTGTLIHGSTIKTEVAALSTIQDDLVIEVAKLLLHDPISDGARKLLSDGATSVPVAYDVYVQGLGYLQHYENADSIDKAIESFNQALERDSKYALAYAGLGEAYWRKYDLTRIEQLADMGKENCQRALQLNDRLAQVYVTLALISNGTGRYEDAVDQVKKSLEINPVNGPAYRELAKAYQNMGKLPEAEEAYQRAIRARSNDWGSYNDLGRFYTQRGRYAEAEAQFLHVIDLARDNVRGYSNLGGIYQAMKRYSDAEQMLKKSLEIRPTAAAYSNLGTIYYFHLKRPADAARMFEKAVEINDRDYRVWRNLAAAYYWSPGERDKAPAAYQKTIELGEKELRINPRNQGLLMNLADSYAMIDQPGRALEYLEKAASVAPLDNDSMSLAAGIYERLGQRALAVDWIAKALCADFPRELVDSDPSLAELRSDPSFEAATNPNVFTERRREKQCR